MWAIETKALCKSFKRASDASDFYAVEPLDLQVPRGKIFGLLGPNGAGKTTTIKMICGLVAPSAGQINIEGFDVGKQLRQALAQIGVVLEGGHNIYWQLSAWQNLLYFGQLKACFGSKLKKRALELLEELDLLHLKDERVGTFSRGTQQKVAIACALIADPKVLLLDEPTLGLDISATLHMKKWLYSLAQDKGKTIILTTHQMSMAEELCDDLAIINQGKLLTQTSLELLLGSIQDRKWEIVVEGYSESLQALAQCHGWQLQKMRESTHLYAQFHENHASQQIMKLLGDQGCYVRSIRCLNPSLEDIFVSLTKEEKK